MRIILVTLGSFGDIKPFLWMGRVFADAGHEVHFIANPYFEKNVREEDFLFHAAGTPEDYDQATIPAAKSGGGFRDQKESIQASRRLFHYMFLKPAKEMYSILSELIGEDTVVFHHFYAYGARLAVEKFRIPGWNICLSPHWLKTFQKGNSVPAFLDRLKTLGSSKFIDGQLFTKPMNEIRSETGLAPLKTGSMEWMFGGKNACLFPEWFTGFPLLESLNPEYIGFPDSLPEGRDLPESLSQFLERYEKPVVFTPGTAFRDVEQFFDAAVYALQRLKRPAVFLTRQKDAVPKNLPDDILHLDFVPLEALLGHCSVLVHHGGIGTCCQALKAGIPQLVCYRMGEQHENSRTPERMGVCRTIPFGKLGGDSMYQQLQLILEDETNPEKCAEMKKRLEGSQAAAKLLELLDEPGGGIRNE